MSTSHDQLAQALVGECRHGFRDALRKIRHCTDQLTDEQLWWRPTEPQNSIANLLLHLAGNVRQWVVSGIGGAADVRHRPQEFAERGPIAKDELWRRLDEVMDEADQTLARLAPSALLEHRRIQGFDTTVLTALLDTVAHFKGHVQEIICLTRQMLGDTYQFDFVPATKEQGAAN